MTIREDIVAEARSWARTPYHHMAAVKGVGVDCGMLLVSVYTALGLVEPFDPRPYTHDWMLHRSEEWFLETMLKRAIIVESPQLGDMVLFKYGRCYSHGAIVTNTKPLTVIHAFLRYEFVIEETISTNTELMDRFATAKIGSLVK